MDRDAMLQFPKEHEAWMKFVHQELKAQLTDIQRLWKRLPQRPDDPWGQVGGAPGVEIGTFPGTLGTGTLGTVNTGGTNTFQTTAASCGSCTSVPAQWQFTAAGITNSLCVTCNIYNGTFILTKVAACQWDSPNGTRCNGGASSPLWRLSNSGGNWDLVLRTNHLAAEARYRLSDASFACLGTNVMPLITSDPGPNNQCASFPANITLHPYGA